MDSSPRSYDGVGCDSWPDLGAAGDIRDRRVPPELVKERSGV